MAVIKKMFSKSNRTKCSSCGEVIPTGTDYSKVGGSKYCHFDDCHTKYLQLNHPEAVQEQQEEDVDEERGLRRREQFAAYNAAGCSQAYYSDRDNGFIE